MFSRKTTKIKRKIQPSIPKHKSWSVIPLRWPKVEDDWLTDLPNGKQKGSKSHLHFWLELKCHIQCNNLDDILIQIRNINDFWIPFASHLVSQSVILHFWPSKWYYRSAYVVLELMAGSFFKFCVILRKYKLYKPYHQREKCGKMENDRPT